MSAEETDAGSFNGRTGRSERLDVGSIPAPAASVWAGHSVTRSGRSRRSRPTQTEVIRLDEEPVLKTGRGSAVVGSSPTASACNTRPWCSGSTTGSNPVSQGSSPWGRALGEGRRQEYEGRNGNSCTKRTSLVRPLSFVLSTSFWACGPTGRRQLRTLEIRVRLPVGPLHATTVPWSSGEDTWPTSREPMVRVHPGPPWPRYANW